MTYAEFEQSLTGSLPPETTPELQSLWFDRKDDWERSHDIAQEISGKSGSWIHAYLHRKEGDIFNAGYWYNKAGKKSPSCTLEEEWELLVRHFCTG